MRDDFTKKAKNSYKAKIKAEYPLPQPHYLLCHTHLSHLEGLHRLLELICLLKLICLLLKIVLHTGNFLLLLYCHSLNTYLLKTYDMLSIFF